MPQASSLLYRGYVNRTLWKRGRFLVDRCQNFIAQQIQGFKTTLPVDRLWYQSEAIISFCLGFLAFFSAFFRTRYNLSLEILALQQQ